MVVGEVLNSDEDLHGEQRCRTTKPAPRNVCRGLLASSRHVRARRAVFPSRCPYRTGTQGHTCETCVLDTEGDQGNTLTGAGMCMA